MKFLHTSDLHLGRTVCGFSMLEEQTAALEQIAALAAERAVDVVFLCGDLYDRSLPPSQAVTLMDGFLTRLIEAGILVCAIAGNHDSGERIQFASRILAHRGLYMEGMVQGEIRYVDWQGDGEPVRIHLLPYMKPVQVRELYQAPVTDHESSMKELLKHVNYLEQGKNILLAHQFVVDHGVEPELSDSESRVSVGGADQVEAANFSRFDYVALGHIHGPQSIGDGPVYYSGSPVKYSFSEVHHKKSVILGEWDKRGALQLERVPLVPIHDMRKIRGRLAELIAPEVVSLADEADYLLAILTDETELADPIGTLRSVYPNVMQLRLERMERELEAGLERTGGSWKEKTPMELFSDFYQLVTGEELLPEQKTQMARIIEEAKEEQS